MPTFGMLCGGSFMEKMEWTLWSVEEIFVRRNIMSGETTSKVGAVVSFCKNMSTLNYLLN